MPASTVPGVVSRFFNEVEIFDQDHRLIGLARAELNQTKPAVPWRRWWGWLDLNLREFKGQQLILRTPDLTESVFYLNDSALVFDTIHNEGTDIIGYSQPPF